MAYGMRDGLVVVMEWSMGEGWDEAWDGWTKRDVEQRREVEMHDCQYAVSLTTLRRDVHYSNFPPRKCSVDLTQVKRYKYILPCSTS